jgi:transcriptional regulator with XRE-family HTH domain
VSSTITKGDHRPFRQWLRDEKKRRHLSASNLAEIAGVSRKTIFAWLNGDGPHHPEAVRLDLEQRFAGQPLPPPPPQPADECAIYFAECVRRLTAMLERRDIQGLRRLLSATTRFRPIPANSGHHKPCQVEVESLPPLADSHDRTVPTEASATLSAEDRETYRRSLRAAAEVAASLRPETELPVTQWRIETVGDDPALFNRILDTIPQDPKWYIFTPDAVRLRWVKDDA